MYTVMHLTGATTAEMLKDQGLGPNTGALAPRARPKVLGAGGVATPDVRVLGYHSRKIFENSDAKSCILVTTMLIAVKFLAL